ncbi:MAG: porin family protein [Desulfovibrionaceae bacterium]|nr:porin family protein [Desulfovibrionaceae bacterium]
MKKLLLTLMLVLAMTIPAFAGDTGIYAGFKVMDSIQSTGKVSTSGAASGFDCGSYSQNTLGGGIFLGYDFYKQGGTPIRAEVEYALRGTVDHDYDHKRANASLKYQYNMHTIFANLYYDFHNDSDFTPYVGGGLGLGIINSKVEANTPRGSDSYNENLTTFAYNLGVGCSYDFNDLVSADFGYRFVGTSYHETDKSIGNQKISLGTANYANEFSLGLRFNF